MATYNKNSVYYGTPQTNGYLSTYTPRLVPNHIDDQVYVVDNQYQYRPDLLAYDLYDNSSLWWAFAVRNPNIIKDPIFDFYPGQKIYIPSKETLVATLGL